jgi:hypothetical protein
MVNLEDNTSPAAFGTNIWLGVLLVSALAIFLYSYYRAENTAALQNPGVLSSQNYQILDPQINPRPALETIQIEGSGN